MSLKKVTNYLSNVGRSVSYASVDILKDKSPNIASLVETNAEVVSSVATGIREYRSVSKMVQRQISSSDLYKAADQAKKSIFEDIRTGNFYNKARTDAINDEILGFTDDDFGDFDFSWDDSGDNYDDTDWNTDDDFDTSSNIAKAVERSSNVTVKALSNTIAGVTEYSVETQKALSHSQILSSIENTSKIVDQLVSINSNIIASRDMDQIHISIGENARKYYEESIELKRQDNAMLKEILDMQRNLYNRELNDQDKNVGMDYEDVVNYQGIPDMKAYFEMVKKNISNRTSSITGMGDMFEGGNLFMTFAASPLEFIPKFIVSRLMTKSLDKSIQTVDKSISGFFSAMATRLNYWADDMNDDSNILLKTIGEIFGVRNRLSTRLDTSKYEKGPVPWDGIARQALVEVIPAYLAQLVALQSGQGERIYDYDRGKFVDARDIRIQHDTMLKGAVRDATYDARENMMDRYSKSFTFSSRRDQQEFKDDMDKFMEYFFNNPQVFDYNRKDYYDFDGLNLTGGTKNYGIIRDLFSTMPRDMQLTFYRDIMSGRSSLESSIRNMESKGDSIYRYLGNESGVGSAFDDKGRLKENIHGVNTRLSIERDTAGHTVFDYLSKITRTLLEGLIVYPIGGMQPAFAGGGHNQNIPDHILNRSFTDNEKYNKSAIDKKYRDSSYDETDSYNRQFKRDLEKGLVDLSSYDGDSITDILNSDAENRRLKELENANKGRQKGLLEELLGTTSLYEKGKVLSGKAKNIYEKPQNILSKILDTVDMRLFEIIYGADVVDDDGNKINGFMQLMVHQLKDTFNRVNTWLDDAILKPLHEKSSVLFNGILNYMGIDVDERGFMKSISNHLFGERDESGEYIKYGILSDSMDKVRQDLSSVKSYLIGKNRTLRSVANLLKEYSNDYTLWNTFDQMNVLFEIDQKMRRFRSMDINDRRIGTKIINIINNTTNENVGNSLSEISSILSSEEYDTGNTSIWGSIKTDIKNIKDSMFGSSNERTKSKLDRILSDKDKFLNESINIDGINFIKFRPLYNLLKEYIFFDNETKAGRLNEIKELLDNIKTSNNSEEALLKELIEIYNSGINNKDYDKMANSMMNAFGTIGKVSEARRVLDIFNKIRKRDSNLTTQASKVINDATSEKSTTDILKNQIIEGSYATGYREVKKDEEIVAVHKGERIITRDTAELVNPVIDIIESIRDGKVDENTQWALINEIDGIINKFKPTNEKENILKKDMTGAIDSFAAGKSDFINVYDILNKSLGIDSGNLDDITPDESLVGQMKQEVGRQFDIMTKYLFGDNEADTDGVIKDTAKSMGDILKDIGVDLQELFPNIATGAILGGAVGLIPGLIGGPLAWATVGIGANLVRNSDYAMERLFGPIAKDGDREGKRIGGIVPKEVLDGIEKFAPSVAKGGMIGAITAMTPFTPFGLLGGIALGGTAALVSKTDTFKDLMFGEDDSLFGPDGKEKIKESMKTVLPGASVGALLGGLTLGGPIGLLGGVLLGGTGSYITASDDFKKMMFGDEKFDDGIISQDAQKHIKEAVPASLLATIGIGAFGPFGLIGSAVLGTVTGIATTSDHFKDAIFGEIGEDGKRDGGFLGTAKNKINEFIDDNIKGPFKNAMDPIKYEIKQIGSTIKESVINSVNSVFEKAVGMPLGEMVREKIIKPFTTVTQKFFSGLGKIMGGIIASPFRMLGWVGDNLRDKHKRDGVTSYSRESDNFTLLENLDDLSEDDVEEMDDISNASSIIEDATIEKERRSQILPKLNLTLHGSKNNSTIGDAKVQRIENETKDISEITRNVELPKVETKEDEEIRKSREKTDDYIKDIRDEVHGQLDGLGYNVEKIKNILVDSFGDTDATGIETSRGNKKRRGIFGRFIDFISKPIDFVKDIAGSITDGVKSAFSKVTDVIMTPFKLLGGVIDSVTSSLGNIKDKALEVLGSVTNFLGRTMETLGNFGLNFIEGVGKASMNLLEGVGKFGSKIFELAGNIPSILGDVISAGWGVSKKVASSMWEGGKKLAKGAWDTTKAVGRGITTGVRGAASLLTGGIDIFDLPGFGNKNEVTITGGKLDEVETVNIVKMVHESGTPKSKSFIPNISSGEVKKDDEEVPALPTQFGMVSFRKNFEGKLIPVKDKIYNLFNKDNKEKDEQTKTIAESTERSAHADEETAESVSIFSDSGNGGGALRKVFNMIPSALTTIAGFLPLLIPFIPKIAGSLGDKLQDILPEGKLKDTIMEPLDNASSKGKVELGAKYLARSEAKRIITGKSGIVSGFARKGIEKGTGAVLSSQGGIKAIQTITSSVSKIFTSDKMISALTKILPESGKEIASKLASKLGGQLAQAAGEAGAEAIAAKLAANATGILLIVMAVKDFATGMSRAEEILRMDGDLPVKFKVIAGLTHMINGVITLGLVPTRYILELLIKLIGTDQEKENIKDAQDKLQKGYDEYKRKELESGKSEKEIMSFREYNIDTNAGSIRRWMNTKKVNRRAKKARKEDQLIEEAAGTTSGGFGLFSRRSSDYNIDDHGCGIRALGLVSRLNTSEDELFEKSLPYMSDRRGLDPKFFIDYARGTGSDIDVYNKFKMRSHIRDEDVIISTNIDGQQHYMVTDGMEGGKIRVIDPDSGNTMLMSIQDILPLVNFGVKIKQRDNSKLGITKLSSGNIGIRTMIESMKNMELSKNRISSPQSITPTNQYNNLSVRSRGDNQYGGTSSDGNVLKNLISIIVSLLKELIKHAQNVDIIVDLLGQSLNIKSNERIDNNLALLSVLDGLSAESSDGEILAMAEQIASIVEK